MRDLCMTALGILADKYGKSIAELCNPRNRSMVCRKTAIYIIKQLGSLTNREIGEIFQLSYSAVSKITAQVERQLQADRNLQREVDDLISHFKG